ncbi:hypothetical protein FRC09_010274 [Ceratobasidium sp. 395]|nr:hypothetical protein FRC09_010274 [Ceratobasidium sp. 395]
MGDAAPGLSTLSSIAILPAGRVRHRITIEEVPNVSLGHTCNHSSNMDIPGSFASSPVNLSKAPAEPKPKPKLNSDEINARIAVTHRSITPEECTDIELCPSDGSITPEDFWLEVDPPGGEYKQEAVPRGAYYQAIGVPHPRRNDVEGVRAVDDAPGGPMYFPHNTTIYTVLEAPSESPVNSAKQKSDETLKQLAKKPTLKAQQRAEDMQFLREIIKDNKRLRRMQKVLPNLVPNNKPLLDEVMEALGELSGAEGNKLSVWDDDVYRVPADSPPIQKLEVMSSEPKTQSPVPGAIVLRQSNEDFEANQEYITAHKPAPTASSEGRKKKKKSKSKKPRPSLGINLEQICPTQALDHEKSRDAIDLKASIAALPRSTRSKHGGKITKKFNPPSDSSDSSSKSSELSSEQSSTSSLEKDNRQRKSRKKKSSKHKTQSEYREENRELKERVKKAQRASIKLKEPTTYFGQENYNKFELWSYETDQWIKASGFSDADAVEYMGTFLKKKARRWYIDHVIPNLNQYTVDSIKMGQFAYCYPTDLKSQLRDEFDAAKQENQKFMDYLQTLKRLQCRIPDISNRQIYRKLWKTIHEYIKIRWIENRMDGETTNLQTLSETAEWYEAAERMKRKNEGFRYPPKPKYIPVQSEPKPEGHKSYTSTPKKPDNANSKPQGEMLKGHTKNRKNKDQKLNPRSDKPRMLREERNKLRAAGKCFVCKEPGHTIKDCPTRNTAKPASVFSAAVQLKHDLIDKLRKQRKQPCIDVASIQPNNNAPGTDESKGDSSYGTCVSEITPANTLLNKIMAAVTLYSQLVVVDNDRFWITNRDLVTVEMTYADIAKQVRETYLYENDERTCELRIESGGERELPYWSESGNKETQIPLGTGTLGRDLSKNLSETMPIPERHWDLSMQLAAMRLDKKNARPKDITCKLPKPLVIQAMINGKPVRALIDSGSLGDFISTTAVDQLKLEHEALTKPIGLQMAVAGSKSSINFSDAQKRDLFNGTHSTELYEEAIKERREALRRYGADLCKSMAETPLPLFRAINHTIPLIDPTKKYHTSAYLNTGRWEFCPGINAIPMLIMMKKSKDGKMAVRTVLDMREINANTHKRASLLPDINEILAEVAATHIGA